jgi:quinoprotein glucose dehydrogenase
MITPNEEERRNQSAAPLIAKLEYFLLAATVVVNLLAGALLLLGGGWLLFLGGSWFYIAAGAAFLAVGVTLHRRRSVSLTLYAALLVVTAAWSLIEAGLDLWPLVSRLDFLLLLGIWMLMPWIRRPLQPKPGSPTVALASACALVALLLLGALIGPDPHALRGSFTPSRSTASPAQMGSRQPTDDWRDYGRTQFGQRYSPLASITPANVNKLEVAWTFETGDSQGPTDPTETTFEVTPIKVRDTVYLCSQHQRLFALDAATGKLKWSYDPHVADNPTFQHLTCRGVAYYEDKDAVGESGSQAQPAARGNCSRRIFLPVNDGRMVALDADSGTTCSDFGTKGTIDLLEGMDEKTPGFYEPTSPPVVSDRVLVVAGAVIDNYSTDEPSGVIRGFDIHTGKLIWAWDSGAQNENALPDGTYRYTDNSPNSWITASYDPDLGLVYVPMGNHTPDIWGGNRPELAERYASAMVALDVNTGKRVWSYQTVHHDLWDMDLPAQPTLLTLSSAAGDTPALVQPTKTGNLFVFDRRDGRLLVPAPERPVPQGPAPGDHLSPTQPFSELTLRPARNLTESEMWGATIFDQMGCRIKFLSLRYDGIFTPPSLQGTLVYPGNLGIFEWGGIAVDPERQIAIANPINMPFVSRLIPRGRNNPAKPDREHPSGSEIGVQPMYGTPYGVELSPFLSHLRLPCLRPPWGLMTGIDLKTQKVVWQHRNGTIRDSGPLPLAIPMGVPSLGGPIVTAGGVAFATGTLDYYIRAYDVDDGREIWKSRLPAGAQSTPMTYAVNGRQYVVTAAGGHGSFGTKGGDYVIAYALK